MPKQLADRRRLLARLGAALVAGAIIIGMAAPARAAELADAGLPDCSAVGLTKSNPTPATRDSESNPAAAGRIRARTSVAACQTVIPMRIPNPAAQDARPLGADPAAALIYCKTTITLYFHPAYFMTATGHFDCSGYVPYYMAIEVGLVNDIPYLGDVVGGTDGFNVAQLNYTVFDEALCGANYAAAARGAIKLSPSDPGTIFPYVFTDAFPYC